MPSVYISVGGNIEPRKHIVNALAKLQQQFSNFKASEVYESRAVGFEGDNFLNLVVRFDTDLQVEALYDYLHQLEDQEGRQRPNGKAWDSRTLDLDILLYGDDIGQFGKVQLPSEEIEQYAHVFLPLTQLNPEVENPVSGQRYVSLVNDNEFDGQQLWVVDLYD